MVNQSAFAPSDSFVADCDDPIEAIADLWAVLHVAETLPATPETRERLKIARDLLRSNLDRIGLDEAALADWVRGHPELGRPPDLGSSLTS